MLSFLSLIINIIVIKTEMSFPRHFILKYNYPDFLLLMSWNSNYFKMKPLFINFRLVTHMFTVDGNYYRIFHCGAVICHRLI